MANEPPTGALFHSMLGTPEMAARLREKMPEFDWRLGDSEQYCCCYVSGKRTDGLEIKITPEDDPDEYYIGVYFYAMAVFPAPEQGIAIAQPIHRDVLRIVAGARKA